MLGETANDLRRIDEQLKDLRDKTFALQAEIKRLEPSIKQADDSQETAQAIEQFFDAANQLMGAEKALAGRIGLLTVVAGDFQLLVKDLARLREVNLRYREAFDTLWRASVPVHVTAILQSEKTTEAEVWERRWGPASQIALGLLAESADNRAGWALRPAQEKALLTMRYANQSLSEVARILDVSPPLVLARQSDLETELVIKLLETNIRNSTGKSTECIIAGEERSTNRRSMAAGFGDRLGRYMRLLTVRCDDTDWRLFLRVVTPDEDQPPLDTLDRIKPDIVALYFLGHHKFKFLHFKDAGGPAIEQAERKGKEDFQEVISMASRV